MFWRLGFISAWRNLARSILAILSMALAAGFMTNAISLSRGYAGEHQMGYRALIGGEISAYSLSLSVSSSLSDAGWRYRELDRVENTDLALMMPQLKQQGYLSNKEERVAFSAQDLIAMSEVPRVGSVQARYQIPALSSSHIGVWDTPLRGRELATDDSSPLQDYILDGRWFTAEDADSLVCVVFAEQHAPLGQRMRGIGDIIRVMVPHITQNGDLISYDFNNPLLCELLVIGIIDLHTRSVNYVDSSGATAEQRVFQLFAQNDEIQIPLATWERIWHQAGGDLYKPQQVALQVSDISYLEDIVLDLQLLFPDYSFYSVITLIDQVQGAFGLEQAIKVTQNEFFMQSLLRPPPQEQSVIALDLRLPMLLLIFINAALVIASNLLIMVSERKTEIGILKAVGSTRAQVVQMVLSEALLISVIGSLIGFIFFRLPAFFNQMTNDVPLAAISGDVLRDLVMVLSVATVSSLVFGMLPALTMANLSVREVLQTE